MVSKKIKNKKVLKIIFTVLIALLIFSIYFSSKIKIEISIQNNKVDQMMTLNIDILKNRKYIEADSLNIVLYHKYKKDEKVELELVPYEPGRYSFYYYPQIQGDYILDVTATILGEEKYINQVIEVI